ncbi:uncharacterized protein [Miscanthus floridulus]|uniref:uncharacterized protein n=1 Tax=Miscanthus floridulus TaxID=154761 RepID=UPI003459A29B
MTPPPGPAEVFQGDGAPLKAEASGENHGPRAAGQRPAGNASDRPAETRRGSGAPLETKAGAGDPGLWAEDRATVGRLLMEAHHLKTHVAVTGGGNRVAAASPFLPGVVLPGSIASTVAAAASALAAISVLTAEVASEVTLTTPPPPAAAEEERETELPASPGGGLHGSPSWSELKASVGDAAGTESERPAVAYATEVVEIPSDDEADDMVELAVGQSEARPSGGMPEGDLEWPCPEDPAKLESIHRESQNREAEVIAVQAEEQCAAERATTVERGLEAVKAYQAETKAGLQKSLADTEAALQESLEALELEQSALVSERNALELARKALESERKARSEADQEVRALQGRVMGTEEASAQLHEQVARQAKEFSTLENFHVELGGKVKSLERVLETIKATFSWNAEELAKSCE